MLLTGITVFALLCAIAALIGGGIWGNSISKKMVIRKCIRRHIRSTCYRCNSCSKVLRYDEHLEN